MCVRVCVNMLHHYETFRCAVHISFSIYVRVKCIMMLEYGGFGVLIGHL